MARSRPLKRHKTARSRYQMAKHIEAIFTSKLSLTYDLVDLNNNAIDDIMLKAQMKPTRENFLNAVDFVNMLTILLYSHDDKAYAHTGCDVPDGYLWLIQKGYQDISETVNRTQDGLLKTFNRGKETSSYALDGNTMKDLMKCTEMYKELVEIMPIRVLQTALETLKDMSGNGTAMPFLKLGNDYGYEVENN